jgi:hypothetical protein
MLDMQQNQSEIANFRQKQALEEHSAKRGMNEYAAVAQHVTIEQRLQQGAERMLQLVEEGRHEEAIHLMSSPTWGMEGDITQHVTL